MVTSEQDNPTDLSTARLVERVVRGQVECFEELVRRYQHEVFRVVSAMLFDRTRVEEFVQGVFVKAFLSLNTFEAGREFGPWIRTIARNLVREELRRSSRYSRRLEAYREMAAADRGEDGDGEGRREQLGNALRACLRTLPERARTALDLRYRQALDFERIAVEMDATPGAVRNLLCRVRERLRQCIRKQVSAR